uniref:15-hydroxyprostaglandin dehydrogenase n=1 Tax=Photinus pyralis TaxID=7054 RepID=A0A1Y1MVB3_PHOPY
MYRTVFWITAALSIAMVLGEKQPKFEGKIALITGAADGLGFGCANQLLKDGLKGVTIIDINRMKGKEAAIKLNDAFGPGRAIFIPADISNDTEFEVAFQVSMKHWKRLDIVVNNAGIVNENNWRLAMNVNAIGTLKGTLLGFKYMSSAKGGRGGVILNMSSLAAIVAPDFFPVYTATKSFIIGLGRSLGQDLYYEHNRVRVVTLCPGFTKTDLIAPERFVNSLSDALSPYVKPSALGGLKNFPTQAVDNVSRACAKVIKDGSNGSVWIVENDLPAYEIIMPDRDSMRKTDSYDVADYIY